jgi:hypothetical protein
MQMTSIETTAFAGLDKEGRLLNAVYKGPTPKPGYFAFRGDFALEFQVALADEKRPPLYSFEGVLAVAKEGEPTIEAFAGYLHDMANIETFKKVVGPLLSPTGTYFLFVNNIDFLAKYTIPMGDATLTVLPCDESTVWKEMTDMCGFDKNDFKKLDGGGKVQLVLDKAAELKETYETISMEEGIARMEPVKNRNLNRPV